MEPIISGLFYWLTVGYLTISILVSGRYGRNKRGYVGTMEVTMEAFFAGLCWPFVMMFSFFDD